MSTQPFDAKELRQALGAFVTGVTVITAIDAQGRPYGVTANSFSSVSLDPPLILWSQMLSSPSHPVYRDADRFVVNILAEDQVDISNRFARSGADKFAGVAVTPGLGGVPLIDGCSAYLECRKVTSYPGGDHAVFLGQVDRISQTNCRPLAFGGGKYLVAQPHDLGHFSLDLGVASLARLQGVRQATQALVELSDDLDETLGLGVWGNQGPTIVRWEESRQPVSTNLRTGLVLPVTASATGLAFAAFLPRELSAGFIEAEFANADLSVDPGYPRNTQALESVLDEVRARGLARIVGNPRAIDEYGVNVTALCAPVFDAEGMMVLGLTAIGAAGQLDANWDAPVPCALKERAELLSRRLGYRG